MRTFTWVRLVVATAVLGGFLPSSARAADVYRRWVSPKTYTCATNPSNVSVRIEDQNTEFANLPVDAQYTVNYIRDGVTLPTGPFTVEQTSGTKAYGVFAATFPAYPFTFDFRVDTIVDGVVVYRSTISTACSADASGTATIINKAIPSSGPFTGTWSGQWSCKALDNGEKRAPGNKTAILRISGGDTLSVERDGSAHFVGATVPDAKKPDKTVSATITDCRTSPVGPTPVSNEMIGLVVKATPTKAKLRGASAFLSDDGLHRVVGTCKYKFKRSSSGDPLVAGCAP